MQQYDVCNFKVMNVMVFDKHFDLYLYNLNDNTFKLESFYFENESTKFLYYILNVLGIQGFSERHEAMINQKLQLLVKRSENDYEIVAIVGKNMWKFIEQFEQSKELPLGVNYMLESFSRGR